MCIFSAEAVKRDTEIMVLSDVQRAVARQALARLHQSKSRALLQSYDRLQRQYDAIVAIESLGHSANAAATLHHWASHLRPGGVVVINSAVEFRVG
jgi:cyclopropane fatty-acyl-phospholipid synthase-like methyltransferase